MSAPLTTVARKHYSVREIYWITVHAALTAWAARHATCDKHASERIMLAVTEVNGCALCSYAHTRMALDMGLPEEEVRGLLSGTSTGVPTYELTGLAFAQQYADTRGRPDPVAWMRVVDQYGDERALCILRATRLVMWGNATGIPLSSLLARVRRTPDPHSSLAYEVLTTLGAAVVLPVAVTYAGVLELMRSPGQGGRRGDRRPVLSSDSPAAHHRWPQSPAAHPSWPASWPFRRKRA